MATIRVAAVQMNTGDDKEANLRSAEEMIDRAAKERPCIVAFPETFNYMGPHEEYAQNAEPIPGPTIARMAAKARQYGIYVHCGSILESSPRQGRFYNASVVVDPQGEIVARYRKIHLFDVELPGHVSAQESSVIDPGDGIVTVDIDGTCCGLSVCYDIRFPELYRILAVRGAHVIFVPAAFTLFTGKDHWEILLRARAIENQVFVLAPAQVGRRPSGAYSYGRSMIVDPWGVVLSSVGDSPGVAVTDLDLEDLARIRRDLPSLRNRRLSAYRWPEAVSEPLSSAVV